MNTLGIDPGLKGCLMLVKECSHIHDPVIDYLDMPLMENINKSKTQRRRNKAGRMQGGKVWSEVDTLKVYNWAYSLKERINKVNIEMIGMRQGQNLSTAVKQGCSYQSALSSVIIALGSTKNISIIAPVVWKKHFGFTGKGKKYPLTVLRRSKRPSSFKNLFKLEKHDGRADAYFIAQYKKG